MSFSTLILSIIILIQVFGVLQRIAQFIASHHLEQIHNRKNKSLQ